MCLIRFIIFNLQYYNGANAQYNITHLQKVGSFSFRLV